MTTLSRRLLLAAPALLLVRPAAAVRLRPDQPGNLTLEPVDPDQVVFRCDGLDGAITLPQARARIAILLPIAGREVAGIAFAADPPNGTLDLLALAGWDGACLRLLGLEVLGFAGANGKNLSSRFAGVGDRTRLRVERTAAIPRPGLPRHWENWTDFLAWRDLAPLTDSPVRPPLAGTRQFDLASARARVIALLKEPSQTVTPPMIAAVANGAP